ncbi:MAG: hypothetical protein AB1651_15730 [Pseudomonadota bacterium]
MSSPRSLICVLAAFAAASLSACDIGGIGDGNTLEKVEISRATALLDRESNLSYLCFSDKLTLIGTFTDGGAADYSERAVWTSSNPAVVEVSNGDILIPGSTTTAFAGGTLIPRAPGTATITAEFVGLSASYDVEVRSDPLDSVEISDTEIKLAPETGRALTLTAVVDGYTLDVTRAAVWSIVEEDSEDIATIDSINGVLSARAVGGPLTARAEFPLCEDEATGEPRRLEATLRVEELAGLTLEREFTDAPNGELIVETSELLKVTGTFASGGEQDLSGQLVIESDAGDVILPSPLERNLVTALKAGTAGVKAVYGGDDGNDSEGDTDPPRIESNVVTLNVVDGTLQDFTIAPQNPTITALGSQQFDAIGRFSVSGTTREQPITRGVVWTVTGPEEEVTSDVLFSTQTASLGQAFSQRPEAGTFRIVATCRIADETAGEVAGFLCAEVDDDEENDLVRETSLCVIQPGETAAACPPEDSGG